MMMLGQILEDSQQQMQQIRLLLLCFLLQRALYTIGKMFSNFMFSIEFLVQRLGMIITTYYNYYKLLLLTHPPNRLFRNPVLDFIFFCASATSCRPRCSFGSPAIFVFINVKILIKLTKSSNLWHWLLILRKKK